MTVINHSETLRDLTLTTNSLVVTKNAGTPAGDPVRVHVLDLNVTLAANIAVTNGALLAVTGGADVSLATTFSIGASSSLQLAGSLSVSALSSIHMASEHAKLFLGHGLAVNLPSDIAGFRGTDAIGLGGVSGTKAVWTQTTADRGTLAIENANNQVVSTLTLDGKYRSSEFKVTSTPAGNTRVGFVQPPAAISSDTVAANSTPSFLAAPSTTTGSSASDLIAAAQPSAADQGASGAAASAVIPDTNGAGVGAYASAFDTFGSDSSAGAALSHLVAHAS